MSGGRMQEGREAGDGRDEDPGVPEALPRTLQHLRREIGAERVDRLWIFPPLRNGRRERGLVTASLYLDEGERRRVITLAYLAVRSGLELEVRPTLSEEGDAPPELLPRVMEGVVRRAGENQADARQVVLEGDPEAFRELLEEFDPELLEPEPAAEPAAEEETGEDPAPAPDEDESNPEPGADADRAVEAET